jgi:predicted acetyltransferase
VKAVYERDGERRGYVIYNATHNWQNAVPMNRLNVVEMAANDPEAYAAIWHYIFSVDLIKEISAYAGLNPPIWWMLADPRRLTRRTRDGLWVRFVDALAALAERKYAANGVVTIELEDPFCPWNSGTYRVESDDGESACERVDGPGGIVVSASALASCYLGANDFNTLAAAGLAEERAPGALARASAMFRWHTSPMTSAPEPLS